MSKPSKKWSFPRLQVRSIRQKLFALTMAIILVVFVFIAFVQSTFLDDVYLFQKEKEIKSMQNTVVSAIDNGELELSNSIINEIQEQGMCITLFVGNNDPIYLDRVLNIPCSFDLYRHSLANQIHQQNKNNPQTVSMQVKQNQNDDYSFLVYHSNVIKDDVTYSIVTSLSLYSMREAQHLITQMLLVLCLVTLVFSLLAAAVLSRRVSAPLLRLNDAANQIRKGNFDVHLPGKGVDELAQLEQNFNLMAHDLSQIDTLRRDLIANVSHDLRTPLTMIKGYAETIRDITGDNKEKREKQIAVIIEESDRLSALISDVLALSKMQSGMLTLNITDFELLPLMDQLLQPYSIYQEKGYHIHVDLSPVTLHGDEKQLGQVILNLLNNAIKHTGEDGNVYLTGAPTPEGRYRIQVTDTGKGIDPEEIPYIWDRYYKARNAKDKLMGTGIGLSIVKEVLNAHHLPYGVISTPGKGSTFWLEAEITPIHLEQNCD